VLSPLGASIQVALLHASQSHVGGATRADRKHLFLDAKIPRESAADFRKRAPNAARCRITETTKKTTGEKSTVRPLKDLVYALHEMSVNNLFK
jgi:hypothetical protein